MRQLAGILILLFSLNSFGGGNSNEVKFANGARLVVNIIGGDPRELLYYPPKGSYPIKLEGGPTQWIKLLSSKNPNRTPEDIVNAHFNGKVGGVTPSFWPVVIEDHSHEQYKLTRLYVGETGEVLKVALQAKGGAYDPVAFSFPDRWEIHRMIYEGKEYLVLVEERADAETSFIYLRLEDGSMAIQHDGFPELPRGVFDTSTGLLNQAKEDGTTATYSPKGLIFKPTDRSTKRFENWWFPQMDQALSLDLNPIGPFVRPSSKEESLGEAKKKEISVSAKGESDILAMRAEKAEFKNSVAQFAETLNPRPPYQVVGKFQYDRFVLGQTGKTTLVVVDTWFNEITDTITLEDENFRLENTPKGYTTTIFYPKSKTEIVYKQPDNESSKFRKISERKESIPEFCKDILEREAKVSETTQVK